MDPDDVFQKDFNTIFLFINLWKQQTEYGQRFRAVEKTMNEVK